MPILKQKAKVASKRKKIKIVKKKKVSKTAQKRAEKKKKDDWDMLMMERAARQREAWGEYAQIMSYRRGLEEEREYSNAKYRGDSKKVEEIEKKRRNSSGILYIG